VRQRVLFVRIGWMTFYQGPQPGDERPSGGGKYNRENVGHEVYNFKVIDGRCFGHFEPSGKAAFHASKRVRLERVDPYASGDVLDDVLVVFTATRPREGGQVVVGWYRNATLHRYRQMCERPDIQGYGYYCQASKENVVLLPTKARTWLIQNKDRSLGQSNVCYTLDQRGRAKGLPWQEESVRIITKYAGENLLENPIIEAEELVATFSGGQGFGLNPEERRAVEAYAMRHAVKDFKRRGFSVKDTHLHQPYDLECAKRGQKLYVEVKGTTGSGDHVFLTKNEVTHALAYPNESALYVISGVELGSTEKGPVATGGKPLCIVPWRPEKKRLKALQYQYDLREEKTR